jgi:hypothetical protein
MCDRCVEPEQVSEDQGVFHVFNSPHPWLPEGVDRMTYFENVAEYLSAWTMHVAHCPELSDAWLSGESAKLPRSLGLVGIGPSGLGLDE